MRRRKLTDELRGFFGREPHELPVVSRTFSPVDLPNLQLAIDDYARELRAAIRPIGYTGGMSPLQASLGDLVGRDGWFESVRVGPVRYRTVDVGLDQRTQCLQTGIHLLHAPQAKIAAHVHPASYGRALELEVMTPDRSVAATFIDDIRERAHRSNVYRGQIISLGAPQDPRQMFTGECGPTIAFHRFPSVSRGEIILPEATMALIERNTVRFLQHAGALRRSGRSVKRGLLLHGKPGTGKTYTAKWLAQSMPGTTVILLTGEQLWLIKECCQLARLLAPSLVIMEDVDLIATERDESRHPAYQITLHQLLNEMDGLTSEVHLAGPGTVMATRSAGRWQRLITAGVILFLVAGAGCARVPARRRDTTASGPVNPAHVYASYQFDTRPGVLSFGVQPLWIPACVIWEVMARDPWLQDDLQRAHCRLNVYPFFKGRDLNAFLQGGKLQGGMSGDLPSLKAATEFDVRIVSLVQQGPCSIVARERVSLETLHGRRIGYAPGSNASYTLLRLLRERSLRPEDVRLVPMDVIDMADAMAAGRIDAFSAWEPTPTLALLDHPDFHVIARADARGYLDFSRRFFDQQPAVVRAMVAAEIRALRWLQTNDKNVYIASGWARDRAVAFAGTELPLTVDDFLRLARRDLLRVPAAPRLLPQLLAPTGELHQQFQLSRTFGLIAPDADWSRVRRSFAVDLVPQILSNAPGFHLDELRLGTGFSMSNDRPALSDLSGQFGRLSSRSGGGAEGVPAQRVLRPGPGGR